MNLSFFIAKKYFLSRKNKGFVNIIALISMLVVAFGTTSLVITLSVFNGIEDLVKETFKNFDSDILITSKRGKFFSLKKDDIKKLSAIDGVENVTDVIEDNVLIKYGNVQRIAKMKAVRQQFVNKSELKNTLVGGNFVLLDSGGSYGTVLGMGLQYQLGMNTSDRHPYVQLYYPKDIDPSIVNSTKVFYQKTIQPVGFFSIEKSYDENYLFVPLPFAEELLQKQDLRSSIELEISEKGQITDIMHAIRKDFFYENFKIITGNELHASLYKVMKIEKLFVFLIFAVILSISSINIFFSITMLIIDKRRDINTLSALGATRKTIQKIFLLEGFFISLTGSIIGVLLGIGFCYMQRTFGIIGLDMQNNLVQSYPILIKWTDVFYALLIVLLVTYATSIYPALKIKLAVPK